MAQKRMLDKDTRKLILRMDDEILDFGSYLLDDILSMKNYDREIFDTVKRLIDMMEITSDKLEDILKRR